MVGLTPLLCLYCVAVAGAVAVFLLTLRAIRLSRLVRDQDDAVALAKSVIDYLCANPHRYDALALDHAEWSNATFGTPAQRGPVGPLKHLKKEVDEILAARTHSEFEEECADALLLLLDAARRGGVPAFRLLLAAEHKMKKNKARAWPKSPPDEPVEHDRG